MVAKNRNIDYSSVPSAVDLENNGHQSKYTVNQKSKGGVRVSKLCLFLMALGTILLILLAIGLTILLYPKCSNAQTPASLVQKSPKSYTTATRLPTNLQPKSYKIRLIPSFETFTTNGTVSIDLNVDKDTDEVVLNLYDIVVDEQSTEVKHLIENETIVPISSQKYDNVSQIYTIKLKESLRKGEKYQVEIRYVAKLGDNMQGFYRSHYVDPNTNSLKWMASTQFSPTDARRAFPCFDEPSFKSKFTISIARPSDMSTISNMPKKNTEVFYEKDHWEWDNYAETPKMSTYLVAFAVSDLRAHKYNSSSLFTVWTRVRLAQQTRLAVELGPKLLQYFEKYFTIDFPLPKIDLVGVPDFGFSAMENWGLITFKENVLLFDEKIGTVDDMQSLAKIMSHEIVHQWFGNLVTPRWWDNLWLKEGFASYFNYFAVNDALPNWQVLDEFLLDEMYSAFDVDSLKSSHSIYFDVVTTEDIRQIFDSISYSKGASVLRMLHHILGEENFKSGLIKYLKTHQYGNAHHEDLWKALTPEKSNDLVASVKDIMDSWITQPGFPVITATRNASTNEVHVYQKRFLLSTEKSTENSLWWVPISFTSDIAPSYNDTKPKIWLRKTKKTAFVVEANKWWLLNLQQTGYYLVNYDEQSWRNLIDHVTTFPAITRVQLISDSMRLARANMLDYDIPLRMLSNIGTKDTNISFITHEAAFFEVSFLYNMLIKTSTYEQFEDFLFRIFHRAFTIYDFNESPSDDYLTQRTRKLILGWSCRKSRSKCSNDAQMLFREWVVNPSGDVLRPNVKKVVFCTAIREGGYDEWKLVYRRYIETESIYEKITLLESLGCSQTPWILSKYLDLILSNSTDIRKQDAFRIFQSVAYNPVGNQLAFDFLRTKWSQLNAHLGPAFNTIGKMVSALPVHMNTEYHLQELEKFKTDNANSLGTSELAFNRAIEITKVNVEWMKHSYHSVEKWLEDQARHFGYFRK